MNFDRVYIENVIKAIKNDDRQSLGLIRQQLENRVYREKNEVRNRFCSITQMETI